MDLVMGQKQLRHRRRPPFFYNRGITDSAWQDFPGGKTSYNADFIHELLHTDNKGLMKWIGNL